MSVLRKNSSHVLDLKCIFDVGIIKTNFSNRYYDTQKVIKQGAQSPGLHFIIRGKVVIVYRGLPILTLGENSFFGESLLLDRNLGIEYM